MADVQRAVEEIRFVMQSEVWEMTDALQVAAGVYAEACKDVNARLRRCDEFLKRGLRSEAIHLADADPNLVETVALLDFPERRDWDEALGLYAISPPEPMRLDIAQELNEAYVVEQPLQKWLAKHRRLALGPRALNQRLAVIRKLASLDAESPFWEEDIREFEKARFREIDADARSAAQDSTPPRSSRSRRRSPRPPGATVHPKALAAAVQKLAAQIDRQVADRELAPLAEKLETAFSASISHRRDRFATAGRTSPHARSWPRPTRVPNASPRSSAGSPMKTSANRPIRAFAPRSLRSNACPVR